VTSDVPETDLLIVSVVIPAYNQRETLRRALLALAQQDCPANTFEVVAADDGSTDDAGEMVSNLTVPYRLSYHWQPNRGRSAVRNFGVQHARGKLLIFMDGDMHPTSSLVGQHLESLNRHGPGVMVKGAVRLSPELNRTPFTRMYLSKFDGPEADTECPLHFSECATGNLSLWREDFLHLGGFDERFATYGWEDLAFGYEAYRQGISLLYNPKALAYHYDYAIDLAQHCRRWLVSAQGAPQVLLRKHPELRTELALFRDMDSVNWQKDGLIRAIKKCARRLLSKPPGLRTLQFLAKVVERGSPQSRMLARLYQIIVGLHIYKGYREGLALAMERDTSMSFGEPRRAIL
jgi:hypothetical protein